MNESKTYIAEVAEICENGDAILNLPDDLLKDMGWGEGTVLNVELVDGSIVISEVNRDDRDNSLEKPVN